ncbi:sensor histidine kinase [Scleromatobacter humisilvae]|uniref:histidine kinase n=1 Tax=Scleromatobacter humisilvae TaxID=2897159 RepID=A0A9X1YIH4_9BURK|nr:ATP-binding protein [Scleromatobacter humisilvae]MCK9684997.1 PAS domain S-box protein [Scleromatobacter humisilvae]
MPEALPALPGVEELFEHFPCGLVVTSARGTIMRVNETLCSWLGVRPEDIVGRKKLQDLFTVGGRIFHQTHWLPMLQMQGSLSEVKFDLTHKDGRAIPMLLNAVRRKTGNGEFDEVSLTISEERNKYEKELLFARKRADDLLVQQRAAQRTLEEAQSRLQLAVRVGALYLWDVDASTLRRRYQPEVALLLGHASPVAVDHDMFLAAIVDEDVDAEASAFRAALEQPGQVHTWAHRLNGADGVQRVVSVSAQAFTDDDGTLAQLVGVASDITESVLERSRAHDRAMFAEQMMAIVSHDLRNPLSAIVMGAQVVGLGNDLSDQKSKALARVVSSARRARRLIDELLDFTLARVGRGLSVNRTPVDLRMLVAKVVDELAPAFPGRGLKVHAIGSGTCTADADRVAQLVGNLVANAMTYGAVDADVTVTSWLAGGMAGIHVHNEGAPIPPALLSAIFEPMVRGTPENSSARSVGLGLFIVRAIADAHGGEVKVRSSAEAGTTFEFSFPAAG